jgi:hypothetical protein
MSINPQVLSFNCPKCGANLPSETAGYTICQYCGTSLVLLKQEGHAEGNGVVVQRGIKMKLIRCQDPEGTGLELFHMLIPAGWQSQGGVRWLLDNPGMPAAINFQVWNPQGGEGFEILPNMNFIVNNNQLTSGFFPSGSKYFGAEVGQPVSIRDAFRNYVLPRYRSMYADLQIIKEEAVPELPQLVRSEAPMTGNFAEGGKVRIGYTWKGYHFEEEIYGVVEVFRARIPSMFGFTESITWFIDYLFSFRALDGKLDRSGEIFFMMLSSFQLNPQWYAAFKSIAQTLIQNQIQQIKSIGQIGQIYAQTGREMREQNLRDWYSRQETYDRLAVDRSRQIRDVDGFFDPHRQEVVELPSGYGHAWANNLGEYILTDNPNFNPNGESNLHWEPMQVQSG